jgi:hypothetical protein
MIRVGARRIRILCAMLVIAACAGDSSTRTHSMHADSAGIDIATHAGADVALEWTFVDRFDIGGKETENESFYSLGGGAWVDADTLGRLYVLDRDASRVLIFDSTGQFVRRMGRSGAGPGEIGMGLAFSVSADGESAVFDVAKRAFVRYGPGGEILSEIRTPPRYFGGAFNLGDNSLTLPSQERDSTSSRDVLMVATASDTTIIASMKPPEGKPVDLTSCGMKVSNVPPLFSPTLRWAGRGDRSAVTTAAAYEIHVFDGNRLTRIIRRVVTPVQATAGGALREQGDRMRIRTQGAIRVCDPSEYVEQAGFAEVIPAIRSLFYDPAGRLWVERGRVRDESPVIDIFDANGDFMGTLPAGSPLPAAFLSDTRIVTVVKDELDVERIVVREIRPAP